MPLRNTHTLWSYWNTTVQLDSFGETVTFGRTTRQDFYFSIRSFDLRREILGIQIVYKRQEGEGETEMKAEMKVFNAEERRESVETKQLSQENRKWYWFPVTTK